MRGLRWVAAAGWGFAACCAGCAFQRTPMALEWTAPEGEPPPVEPCGWVSLPSEGRVLDRVEQIQHTVRFVGSDESLSFRFPESGEPCEVRTAGNGLTFVQRGRIDDRERVGFVGRWAGWRWPSASFNGRLYDVTRSGDVEIESDAGAFLHAEYPSGVEARGVALVLTGLDAGRNSEPLLERLRDDGWAIVQIYNLPRMYNLRLGFSTEPWFASAPDLPAEVIARELSEIFESRHCGIGGAVKAGLALLHEDAPGLVGRPTVLIGLSAGALYAPGVFASLGDTPDAVVLVAGGASMFRVIHGSALMNWNGPGRAIKSFLDAHADEIDEAFLAASARDAANTAPLLPRERTLIVHARDDGFVPAETGETLWERAGRPERWVLPGGHVGLFGTFAWHADDIAAWVDTAAPAGRESGHEAMAGPRVAPALPSGGDRR